MPDKNHEDSDIEELSGNLLIAAPYLDDEAFARTVIFMGECSEQSIVGFILNRPLGKNLGEVDSDLSSSDELSSIPLFQGGPVAPHNLFFASYVRKNDKTLNISFHLTHEKVFQFLNDPNATVLAFAGYCEWKYDQLRSELRNRIWYVSDMIPSIITVKQTEQSWDRAMSSLSPLHYIMRLAPLDATLN